MLLGEWASEGQDAVDGWVDIAMLCMEYGGMVWCAVLVSRERESAKREGTQKEGLDAHGTGQHRQRHWLCLRRRCKPSVPSTKHCFMYL